MNSVPGVVTYAPDGVSDRRWLGEVGHLGRLAWSSTMPGGDEQFSAALQVPALYRHPALAPGRVLQVIAGGVIWEGRLDRPAPASDRSGWDITAHGSGTYGNDYDAIYTTYTANDVLNQAIGRGLRWSNPGTAGGFLGQPADSASQNVTSFLNAICSPGSETWFVDQPGNVLTKFPIPSAPTRILVTTIPAAPDLVNYIDALYVRYQSSADAATAATYGLASATLPASITAHGRTESYWDLGSNGQMSAATAAGFGAQALAKYVAASFAQPFTVTYGHYLTMGGVPVDLPCERAGEVVRLLLAAGGFGGEVAPMFPVTFPVGSYSWDQDSQTAQITAYQSVRSDFAGLLGALGLTARAPAQEAAVTADMLMPSGLPGVPLAKALDVAARLDALVNALGSMPLYSPADVPITSTTPIPVLTHGSVVPVRTGSYYHRGIITCVNGSSGTLQGQTIRFMGSATYSGRMLVYCLNNTQTAATVATGTIVAQNQDPSQVRTPALNETFLIIWEGTWTVTAPGTLIVSGREATSSANVGWTAKSGSVSLLMPATASP